MRRLLVLGLLLCLAAPTAAWAFRRAPGDGTLAVRNGDGNLQLNIRSGAVIGKLEAGMLIVTVPTDDLLTAEEVCRELEVWGADRQPPAEERERGGEPFVVCRFHEFLRGGTPEAIRLRLIGDRMSIAIRQGVGFSLSAVARGSGYIQGAGGADGTYSKNGEPFVTLPDEGERFLLRSATLP